MISTETLAALGRASTATLTTQLFKRGFRNAFLHGVRPLGRVHRFAGEAFTLRFIPAREDLDVLGATANPEHPQRKAFETIGPGQVLVMDCRGETRAACAGDLLVARMIHRGAAGLVTDGALRDSPALAALEFPIFGAGAAPTLSLALHHAADLQVPVGCAGVPVYPGDVMVADGDGVVCIPRHLAAEVAEAAVAQDELEAFLLRRLQAGAPIPGTYPPSEETQAAYRAWRAGRGGAGAG
jgi:regulator of RNase E activity RraA